MDEKTAIEAELIGVDDVINGLKSLVNLSRYGNAAQSGLSTIPPRAFQGLLEGVGL